ncbi:MAG: Nucleoside-diphosphate-sugar pyrophosphorylase involved in lipopolysaccharide biosynthesis/translati [Marinobacter excellens HL-55]|uniref:Nucleoside-diphosphate-sugar pyrophosphorylase involved in lipopolysaccharide biosynthesis/translati n=1 Tax=Marinobacter excellens HL-55 TaxID=1305731 RepID=A0A0P7Z5U7_9GAMM|nr:MAG: Nucleoside-diphosphate-sugar pyrophosphorylase involved in lipopolysaccharide biosynthesis/translati [Marinobacter excellens HL-55]
MKAMILAAGKGERMRPLTLHTPKPLLIAGGKALINYHLENLHKAGFRDVVINHAWLGQQIEQQLGNGSQFGLNIRYSAEGEPLETAGGIVRALPLLTEDGDDWFLVINGDIWTDFPLDQLRPPANSDCDAILVMADNPDQHPDGDFQLAPDGSLSSTGASKLTFSGISLLHRSLFSGLDDRAGKLGPVLRNAMANRRVQGLHHHGQWVDVGTPQRLTQLDDMLSRDEPTP